MVVFKVSSILIGFSEAVKAVAIEFLTLISFGVVDATVDSVWTSFG